ncbi:MAG: nucleotidyltransferase domain-containing protein [Chloroflexi bacterium]|nr:nucleotidyltransferase domain-containing protein [Chloroflexota bacterium]
MDESILARLHVTEDQIAGFCRKWEIVRFELFGSILRDDFDAQSDVDVLVTFADEGQIRLHDLIDMEEELKALFGRKVDLIKRHLVEESPNWIRRTRILNSARVVYAAS